MAIPQRSLAWILITSKNHLSASLRARPSHSVKVCLYYYTAAERHTPFRFDFFLGQPLMFMCVGTPFATQRSIKHCAGTVPELREHERSLNEELLAKASHVWLQKHMEVSMETENCSEETEEIRKLDSQLDHLNDYMSKMEERLKLHNEKLMETLRHQKEEREKRRRSFHERMTQNQAEDTAFQQQMASILNRVDSVRNRQSIYDIVNSMDIPKVHKV
ncbi:unnamed protein product [Cylicocyclus nassatus]|uniref:Uncharacterized protein n=1 Tax=Cylicocyclus nassatus TaxID=53992 RepID=A0AA36MEI4_CYLNA|nr:unnamed protein product [Cylicocyclus nassatus]